MLDDEGSMKQAEGQQTSDDRWPTWSRVSTYKFSNPSGGSGVDVESWGPPAADSQELPRL